MRQLHLLLNYQVIEGGLQFLSQLEKCFVCQFLTLDISYLLGYSLKYYY
jgi:hypothetical protein